MYVLIMYVLIIILTNITLLIILYLHITIKTPQNHHNKVICIKGITIKTHSAMTTAHEVCATR